MTSTASETSPKFWAQRLMKDGYCILPDAVPVEQAQMLNHDLDGIFDRTPFCRGAFFGPRTKRFGGLLTRTTLVADFVRHPLILAIAESVLGPWCDRFNLNLTQGIEIHPDAPAQYPHRDQDMWQGAKGQAQYLLNVIWPLTAFSAENGATLLWPGSHTSQRLNQADPGEAIAAEMAPGAALLFLGSTLHGAGANRTLAVRRAMIVSYCLGWLKPFENQWLCYPPDVARHFDPDLARLVGYSLHRPNLGNYEGQCPSVLLGDFSPDHLAATDALRPEQDAALEAFVAEQSGTGPTGPGGPS